MALSVERAGGQKGAPGVPKNVLNGSVSPVPYPVGMRPKPDRRRPTLHGYRPLPATRFAALYIALLGWLVLGAALYARADWPASCTPAGPIEVYACSPRLPETGRWAEMALLTWLWATPILALLEAARHLRRVIDR
jgi:hypothetical protein